MQYTFVIHTFGNILTGLIQKEIQDKAKIKDVKQEYKAIILRAKDIGTNNLFITSYAMGAYFLAMCRKTDLSPEKNYDILNRGIGHSLLFKLFLGNANQYLSVKRMKQRKEIAKQSHQKKYQNDWVWDVIDPDNTYDGGYNYHECGVCKLFQDEGAFELAKYVCKLDYGMFQMIGIDLTRTKTIADGDALCDFRFKKSEKQKN